MALSAPYVRVSALIVGFLAGAPAVLAQTVISSRVTLDDPAINDQDDMCIWIHPTDRSLSTIIASDKAANRLFVYDLQGNTLQVIPTAGQPGNIDVRYRFGLAGSRVDIVAFNDRTNRKIEVYGVDPATRQLARVDNGAITTGANYGLCLYRSPISGAFYAFTTAQDGGIGQYELRDEGGQVAGSRLRGWDIGGQTEGCVCDDETRTAYFGEEAVGIWKVGAEPGDPSAASLIARTGDASGLTADVEGLTLYYAADSLGFLIASSQGSSSFKVYQRKAPHNYVKTFVVSGVTFSDGVDVTNVSLGPAFPSGIIAVHNHTPTQKTVEVCAYEDVGLPIDTQYWDPTPTLISLSWVRAEPGYVHLAWYGAGAAGSVATVYRRTEASDWSALSEVTGDGLGHLVFEDHAVEAGRRYGYRLGIRVGAGEEYLGEVWVDVPSGYQLALQGARPNPAERDLVVSFSLPDERPATLEIYDLGGRRLWTQRVERLGAGSHLLNLAEQTVLRAGVYIIRLTRGSRSLTSRAVVVR